MRTQLISIISTMTALAVLAAAAGDMLPPELRVRSTPSANLVRAAHSAVGEQVRAAEAAGGAALAAEFGALSCDHLEWLSDPGITAMASAGSVAVLLPGAFYFLRETRLPPVQALRSAGVPIALATDHNPGSSPILSPTLVFNLACTLFRLTPEEALRGMTVYGARALGLHDRGVLALGMRADFALWELDHPAELAYWVGQQACRSTVLGGKVV